MPTALSPNDRRTWPLANSPVDHLRDDGEPSAQRRWYYGCGRARLALRDGIPAGIVYDSREFPDEMATLADLPEHDSLVSGMVSSWEFVADPMREPYIHADLESKG